MSIFSRSFQLFLGYKKSGSLPQSALRTQRGFTLIELLVTMSIFLVIITVVVFRFVSFDSIILLKTLGYDVALSVREAQSYSISVLGNTSGDFRAAYGVSFSPNETQYAFFRDAGTGIPEYNAGVDDTVSLYSVGSSYTIVDVCIDVIDVSFNVTTLCNDDGIGRVDISFRRPEYRALFHAEGYGGSSYNITQTEVKLQSTDGTYTTSVVVLLSGQIKVEFTES